MDKIPSINYSDDPNYNKSLFRSNYFALVMRLIVGLRKAMFEYLKAYIVFPIVYRKKWFGSRKLTSDEQKYIKDGIIKLKFPNDIIELRLQIEAELSLSLYDISTGGDPRFKIKLSKMDFPAVFAAVKRILEDTNAIDMARVQLKRDKVRLEEEVMQLI